MPCSEQVYTRLSERLGLADHLMVLNVMLGKIATNLKVYGSCDDVITLTLNLFQARALPAAQPPPTTGRQPVCGPSCLPAGSSRS